MAMELEEQYDRIYRYCYYRVHNQQLAEDITQQVFLKYFERREKENDNRPLALLYTMAKNLCIDEFRRKKTCELPETLPALDTYKPLEEALALKQALESLTEQERELVLLRYVNEVPMADLVKLYQKTRFALYRQLKKILIKLKRGMEGEENMEEPVKTDL